jgi:outer membrane immunogenic protein
MNKIFAVPVLVLAGAVAVSAAANAAPVNNAAPEVAAPVNWTGFYVGGDIGGLAWHGHGTSDFLQSDASADAGFRDNFVGHSPSISSVTGGVYAGLNWQFVPSWVIGLEADWQPTHLQDSFCRQTDILSGSCSADDRGFGAITSDIRLLGSARGRLGWAFDQTMIYATGGGAFADVRTTLSLNCTFGCGLTGIPTTASTETSSHKTGWIIGGGIERMFGQNWIVRAEYLHIGLGNVSNTLFIPPANCVEGTCALSSSQDLSFDIVRLGLSYKFGGF